MRRSALTSIPGSRVVRVTEQLIDLHGRPSSVRLDNGSELSAAACVISLEDQAAAMRPSVVRVFAMGPRPIHTGSLRRAASRAWRTGGPLRSRRAWEAMRLAPCPAASLPPSSRS